MAAPYLKIPLGETELQIDLHSSIRAKRLNLKLDPYSAKAIITSPPGISHAEIKSFLDRNLIWIKNKLLQRGHHVPFKIGETIPVLGSKLTIKYTQNDLPKVCRSEELLTVQGFDEVVVPGLIKDWLRQQVYENLKYHTDIFADKIDQKVKSITLKEMKSRWGSCSHNGRLSYNWRLVFAPAEVLEYVCAHEVAHLIEMNHSSRFWNVVQNLNPSYQIYRDWLKKFGNKLFLYG